MKMLKALRLAGGFSGRDLYAVSGVHPSTLSLIESGRLQPYDRQLKALASSLGWVREPELLLEEAMLTKSTAVLKRDLDDA